MGLWRHPEVLQLRQSLWGHISVKRWDVLTPRQAPGFSSPLAACQAALQTQAKCMFAQGLLEFLPLWLTQMTGIQPHRNSCSVAFIICPLINWCMQETCSPSYSKCGYATLIRGLLLYQHSPAQIISATWTRIILDKSEVPLQKETLFQASLSYEHKYRF